MVERVQVVEVGPRDGLQNEPDPVATEHKLEFIRRLRQAGLQRIEVTSFVHPRWVPQLADAEEVVRGLPPGEGFSVLVPNRRGLQRALAAGVREIAVFTAASETFNRKNTRRTLAESLEEIARVVEEARGLRVRGYISTAFVCPYEGEVPPRRVVPVARALLEMGIGEISLGDTLGAAAPTDVQRLLEAVLELAPARRWALHFHDTCGTALANVLRGLEMGVAVFDASAGGLGGCPYAPGASGNLATEDLVYMLDRMGIETGVDRAGVLQASRFMEKVLGRPLPARQLRRMRG